MLLFWLLPFNVAAQVVCPLNGTLSPKLICVIPQEVTAGLESRSIVVVIRFIRRDLGCVLLTNEACRVVGHSPS